MEVIDLRKCKMKIIIILIIVTFTKLNQSGNPDPG